MNSVKTEEVMSPQSEPYGPSHFAPSVQPPYAVVAAIAMRRYVSGDLRDCETLRQWSG